MVPAARCMRRDSGGRSYVARCGIRAAYRGLAGVAFRALCVERGASQAELDGNGGRCLRRGLLHLCQGYGYGYGGGVVRMDKGDVVFDGVAISGTVAQVRIGGQRCVSGPRRVGGAGRRRCGRRRRRMWLGRAQSGGGVVSMSDGAVMFKGGTITNTTATVSTGHDGCWRVCPRCSMLRMECGAVCVARCMWWRQSMVHSSYAVCAARRMPHLVCDRLCEARCMSLRTLCCIARVVPCCGWNAAWCIVFLRMERCLAHRFAG
jgi:hypothetical protein